MGTVRKQRPRKFTRLIADKLWPIHVAIQSWSLEDLKAIANDCLLAKEDNCWWYEHQCADAIREIVLVAIKDKEDTLRRAAKVMRTDL